MESRYSLINISLGLVLILLPLIFFIFLLENQFRFIMYFLLTLVFGVILLFLLANFMDGDINRQLQEYGVNGHNNFREIGDYNNVSPQNMEKVKELEKCLMGIGWQMRAIISIPLYLIYILLIYPLLI